MAGMLCAEAGEQHTTESVSSDCDLQPTPVVDTLYLKHFAAVFNFHNFPDLKHTKYDCFHHASLHNLSKFILTP